jgi:beta-galactosidase
MPANDPTRNLPEFPFGAVYYRVSNPPREDWERDYQTAAEDGNNIFRHWFLWSAIERSPGEYTWDDYDRQLDLGAKHGIKAIIAEMIDLAPEWTARLHPNARTQRADGSRSHQQMHGSCATGHIHMCLDKPDLFERAEEFLTRLVERYRDHPGLGGYDIWNECNTGPCFCDGTIAAYQAWLREKYDTIEALREAWMRPGIGDWTDATPPLGLQPYNDSLDWLKFSLDNAYAKMKWRADLISELDPDHPITAHGLALTHRLHGSQAADDWRAASLVESYGLTWGSSRHGDERWKQPRAMDMIRNASRGKPFWHAEAYGGPLWLQQNVLDKPRDEGRIATPEDIRYWNLTSYMHGAVGTLYLRWRPLLNGPLFGAFGPYGMDGSRTERSQMSTEIGRWIQASEQSDLRKSTPLKGEVGILMNPETHLFHYTLHRSSEAYEACYNGAYRGFFDNNIQADFVHVDDIDEWNFLYFPYPVMMSGDLADRLAAWVKGGGTLVIEGCPAYWGDRGRVGTSQPNLGLDELLGARESYVEFTPDLLEELDLRVMGRRTPGGMYMQAYELAGGTAAGWYEDGRVAAVEHRVGTGKTLLVGTMPSHGYDRRDAAVGREYFARVFEFGATAPQHVRVSDERIRARIHTGEGGTFLWIANHVRADLPVTVSLSKSWTLGRPEALRGPDDVSVSTDKNEIQLTVPARDVAVYRLANPAVR